MILLDFQCDQCGIVAEQFVPSDTQTMPCACGCRNAKRIISGTSFVLDGTDPAFPTAWDRWGKQHEKAGGQSE